ncbi:MAG: hypothetical protein LUQ65_11945, partial [Candidatus Helarchaeota archaeon]|nr:hypothetical protein [Candidatus Helarchaeota archaeon]
GLQKTAIGHKELVTKRQKRINQFLWVFGTALIILSTFVLMQAEMFGYLFVISSMTGVGIISVVLFSYFFLKEHIGRNELIGICLIVIGTFVVPLFSSTNTEGTMDTWGVTFYSLFLIIFCVCIAIYAIKSGRRFFGVIFGTISGIAGGLSIIFQYAAMRLGPTGDLFADIWIIVSTFPAILYFILFAVGGVLEFLITQYAFTNGKAIEVVPPNQSFFIIVPIAGGAIIFAEAFNILQIIGFIVIIIGVILCTAFKSPSNGENK